MAFALWLATDVTVAVLTLASLQVLFDIFKPLPPHRRRGSIR